MAELFGESLESFGLESLIGVFELDSLDGVLGRIFESLESAELPEEPSDLLDSAELDLAA